MSSYDETAKEFCAEFGEALLTDLFEALYEHMANESNKSLERMKTGKTPEIKSRYPNIYFHAVARQDAINVEAWGFLDNPKDPEAEQIEFRIIDGDAVGSALVEYGMSLKDPMITITKMVPKMVPLWNFETEEKRDAYIEKFNRMKPELDKLAEEYNYDKHFAPGGKIRQHYKDKAAAFPFVWESESFKVPVI